MTKISSFLIFTFILTFLAPLTSRATDIYVNEPIDELNQDGDCSLREAIEAAETDQAVDGCSAGIGADRVFLSNQTYFITQGSFHIYSDIELIGQSSQLSVVSGGNFYLHQAAQVRFESLGITAAPDVNAGAIDNDQAAVTIYDSEIYGNLGHGLKNLNHGSSVIQNSKIDQNALHGIFHSYSSQGSLQVFQSVISNHGFGSGIYANDGGLVFIEDSVIEKNNNRSMQNGYRAGGAIYAGVLQAQESAQITISNSKLLANESNTGGALFIEFDQVTIVNTSIEKNKADSKGAVVIAQADQNRPYFFNLENSTLSENTSDLTTSALHFMRGSFPNTAAYNTILNSTISDNSSEDPSAPAINITGSLASPFTITSSTIASNSGSGVFADYGTVSLKSTILAFNGSANCQVSSYGSLSTRGFNIETQESQGGNTCQLNPSRWMDQINMTSGQLQLLSLAHNGGPTQTRGLSSTSAAIDKGSCSRTIAYDQRGPGYPRSVAVLSSTPRCDVGAYEYQGLVTIPY